MGQAWTKQLMTRIAKGTKKKRKKLRNGNKTRLVEDKKADLRPKIIKTCEICSGSDTMRLCRFSDFIAY